MQLCRRYGEGPTIRGIGEHVGLSSTSSVLHQLRKPEQAGMIRSTGSGWRSTRLGNRQQAGCPNASGIRICRGVRLPAWDRDLRRRTGYPQQEAVRAVRSQTAPRVHSPSSAWTSSKAPETDCPDSVSGAYPGPSETAATP
ncbi:LexA family protein [Streptomyces sp. NPDC001070]